MPKAQKNVRGGAKQVVDGAADPSSRSCSRMRSSTSTFGVMSGQEFAHIQKQTKIEEVEDLQDDLQEMQAQEELSNLLGESMGDPMTRTTLDESTSSMSSTSWASSREKMLSPRPTAAAAPEAMPSS